MVWQPRLRLSAAPSELPVSVDDARQQCRQDINDDDVLLERKIKAATRRLEMELDRQFCTATWIVTSPGFPCYSQSNPYGSIYLPAPPLQSVTSVTYVDASGSSQTFGSSSYIVETPARGQGAIHLESGVEWPSALSHPSAVQVAFIAGYGGQGDVPDAIKESVLALVAHMYLHRGDDRDESVPEWIMDLASAESWGSVL